ncbi:hypothetical protein L0F63_000494 [Massospora cicadina]|nr:hypothetical protein L0F63_000494 [Massospora cicadina]
MAEEEDFSKLSIDDKIQHKSWKARVEGYTELAKELGKLDPDGQMGEFRKYGAHMVRIAKDSNLPAQEAGMACIMSYIEYAPNSERYLFEGLAERFRLRDELVPVIIQKGLGSARAGTRTRSIEDLILNELGNKQPKIVAACVMALKSIVAQFGAKAVNVKAILKNLGKIFGHSDKAVRQEATGLALAIYPWLSKAIDPFLADLKPVQIKELQAQFDALPQEKPKAPRLLRSQQSFVQEELETIEEAPEEDNGLNEEPVNIDPYELAEPVDITNAIPPNLYTQLVSHHQRKLTFQKAKKWQERKEVLEALETVVNKVRLADSGPYTDLVAALTAHINDTNVVVSLLAITCLKHLAAGLRNHFAAFKPSVLPILLQRLKEKKQTFVDALRGCLDAVFASVTLSDVLDDILGMFGEKNPQIKAECVRWLIRILKTIKAAPTKAEVKKMCEGLLKTYADGDTNVREASAECLGILMKVSGEKAVVPFIESLDNLKMAKVKEYFASAEVQVRQAPPKPKMVTKGPSKDPPKKDFPTVSKPAAKPAIKPSAKPSAKPVAKAPVKKPAASTSGAKNPNPPKKVGKEENVVFKFTPEEVDDRVGAYLSQEILEGVGSAAWKTRLEAMEQWISTLERGLESELEPEILIRQLGKKPAWKEANFQVLSKMFKVVEVLATRCSNFSTGCAALAIPPLVDKLGDIKLKKAAMEALDAIIERLSLRFVLAQSCPLIAAQKSPKVQGDALLWIKQCLNDFGIAGVVIRPLVDFTLGPLASSNATVRSNAVKLLAELRVYVGLEIRVFVQDVNQNLLNIIDAEFSKVEGRQGLRSGDLPAAERDAQDMQDELFPRVDISPQINSALLALLSSDDWKKRKEGLDAVAQILEAANKRIKPTLGELLPALKARLEDKNLNLVVAALDLLGTVAEAVGKPYEKLGRPMVGPICSCINNPKLQNRAAAIGALTKMADTIGLGPMLPAIAASLAPELPLLCKDVLKWLSEKLPVLNPSSTDQLHLLTPVMQCLSDKNPDVRKGAQATLAVVIERAGVAAAKDRCAALKPALQPPVMAILDGFKGAKPAAVRPPSRAGGSPQPKRTRPPIGKPRPQTPRGSESAPEATLILTNDPRQKELRLSREKPSRWTFEVPPADLIDSLKEACAPHLSADLIQLLFSTGTYRERNFLAGLTQLEKGLGEASLVQRNLSVSDLVLRYVAIRLHDQGSTMIIKCLDLLQLVFKSVDEAQSSLADVEAAVLLPSLIARLGLNNETLRKRVKELVRQLCRIYSSSGVFAFLLEHGLRSKNARTRTETLDELGGLIQRQGMGVMASPAKALPAVATLIGDRDAGVRNAAIATILQAYILVGEKVYKYLGPLSDRDRGYLEERFKRTKTLAPPPPPKAVAPEETGAHIFSFQRRPSFNEAVHGVPASGTASALPSVPSPPPRLLSRIPSPARPISASFMSIRESRLDLAADVDPVVQVRTIADRLHSGLTAYVQAGFRELEKMVAGPVDALVPHASILLEEMCQVFDSLISKGDFPDPNFTSCIRAAILAYLQLFQNVTLTSAFTPDALRHTLHSIVTCLLDQKVKACPSAVEMSRSLNVLLVRLLANADLNAAYEAIFQLLLSCIEAGYGSPLEEAAGAADLHVRYSNLVMKCSWKLARRTAPAISHGELDCARFLGAINDFFVRYPHAVLRQMAEKHDQIAGIIMKTLNTLLYSMCEALRDDIYHALQFVPRGSPNDHLSPLIARMLTKLAARRAQPELEAPPPEQDLAARLQEIIALVDNSERNREGIRALYAFQVQNPDYCHVVEEQLELRGPQFYNFVQRSLSNLRRQSEPADPAERSSSPSQYHTPEAEPGLSSLQDGAAGAFNHPPRSSRVLDRETPSPLPPRPKTVGDLRARLAELRMANGGPLTTPHPEQP